MGPEGHWTIIRLGIEKTQPNKSHDSLMLVLKSFSKFLLGDGGRCETLQTPEGHRFESQFFGLRTHKLGL